MQNPPRKPDWIREEGWALGVAVVVGVLARLLWGFRLGVVNNEFHFPILLSARENLPFRGDALVATLENFASPLWFFLSALPTSWGVESILEVVFVFSRILLAWGFGLVVGALVSDAWRSRARLVGAVSTLASGWVLNLAAGADPVVSTYFSQTFLSIGLLACALGLGFSRKGWASALFLGLAYDVNLMQANFAAGILLPVWILNTSADRKGALKLLQSFAITAVAGAPGLLAVWQVMGGPRLEGALAGRELSDYAAFHIPGHFFWAMKAPLGQAQALSLVLLAPLAAWLSPRRSRSILAAAAVPLVYFAAQIVLQQALPSRFLFQLHLFRSDVVCYLVAAGICIGAAIESASTLPRRQLAIWMGVSVLVLTGNFIPALALLVGKAFSEKLAPAAAIATTLGVFGAMLVLERSVGASATTIAVSCLAWLSILPAPKHRLSGLIPDAIGVACLVALGVMSARTCMIDIRRSPESLPERIGAKYRAALERAQAASSTEALFSVPPSRNTRPVLRRGVYWSIWDGAGFLWRAGHEREVLRRMSISGVKFTPGVQYIADSIDRQWANSLCANVPKLTGEGVDWVVVPLSDGRLDPAGEEFAAFPMDSLEVGSVCPQTPPDSMVGNVDPR